jgi:hypothetical protein
MAFKNLTVFSAYWNSSKIFRYVFIISSHSEVKVLFLVKVCLSRNLLLFLRLFPCSDGVGIFQFLNQPLGDCSELTLAPKFL